MTTDFWPMFWTVVFVASLVIFAGVTIVVAVGGYRDLRAMFRNLDEQHAGRADADEER